MRQTVHFAMQSYRMGADGGLINGLWRGCESEAEALRRAELAVSTGKSVGAAVLRERNSGEFEEGEGPVAVAVFGMVRAHYRWKCHSEFRAAEA